MNYDNPNCDGSGPHAPGEVRVLPTSRDPHGSNAILCAQCFVRELRWRRLRNQALEPSAQFPLPDWSNLEVYLG